MTVYAHNRVFDRYVNAVLTTAGAESQLKNWLADADRLRNAIAASDDLKTILAHPRLPATKKEEMVAMLSRALGLHKTLHAALCLFVRKGRGATLAGFVDRLIERLKIAQGIQAATVITAQPLSKAQEKELSAHIGPQVELDVTVDPALMGGMIVQVGSWRMDDSIKGKLDRLAQTLAKVA